MRVYGVLPGQFLVVSCATPLPADVPVVIDATGVFFRPEGQSRSTGP